MPVLDTVVLFGAADPKDPHHEKSTFHLKHLIQPGFYIGSFALFEFDIVMKSRGMSYRERMVRHALLARDHPATTFRVKAVSPQVLYLTSRIEGEEKVDYFDAGVAAEAQALDGSVVSTDSVFDRISGSGGSGESQSPSVSRNNPESTPFSRVSSIGANG